MTLKEQRGLAILLPLVVVVVVGRGGGGLLDRCIICVVGK